MTSVTIIEILCICFFSSQLKWFGTWHAMLQASPAWAGGRHVSTGQPDMGWLDRKCCKYD